MQTQKVNGIAQQGCDNTVVRLKNQLKQTRKKFEIEKNCKNKAYCFIMACGLMDSFAVFCREYSSDDWHKDQGKKYLFEERCHPV